MKPNWSLRVGYWDPDRYWDPGHPHRVRTWIRPRLPWMVLRFFPYPTDCETVGACIAGTTWMEPAAGAITAGSFERVSFGRNQESLRRRLDEQPAA